MYQEESTLVLVNEPENNKLVYLSILFMHKWKRSRAPKHLEDVVLCADLKLKTHLKIKINKRIHFISCLNK